MNYVLMHSNDPYLMHYGIKGMKWGRRKEYEPVGRRRRGFGYYHNMSRNAIRDYKKNSSKNPRSEHERKIARRYKVAKGAAIATSVVLGAYGAYKWGKFFKTPTGQAMINQGKQRVSDMLVEGISKYKSVQTEVNVATAVPRNVIRQLPGGRMMLKGMAAASVASDVNTGREWALKIKKQGKFTKIDARDLALDVVNPLPDNLPGLGKNKRKKRL